jgi:hypothetical protein
MLGEEAMSQLRRPLSGSFIDGFDELIPALAIQPTQIGAIAEPATSSALLTRRTRGQSRRVLERRINELLSGQSLH